MAPTHQRSPSNMSSASPLSPSAPLSAAADASSRLTLVPRGPCSGAGPTAGPINSLVTRPVVLPARAKPGRKPNSKPAATAQAQANRQAQQKHRQKKKREREEEIEAEKERQRQIQDVVAQNAQKDDEIRQLKRRIQQFERERQDPSPVQPESSVSSPQPQSQPQISQTQLPSLQTVTSPLSTPQSSVLSPATAVSPTSTVITGRPVPGGCGGCVEGGSCPCVDSLINMDADEDEVIPSSEVPSPPQPVQAVHLHSRNSSVSKKRSAPGTVSIQSLLQSDQTNFRSPAPVTPSYTEHEIDFTKAFRTDTIMPSVAPNRCGACPPDDTGSCLCRKVSSASASWNALKIQHDDGDDDSDSATAVASRSTSAAASGPGSCARCQADPQQRAWCQGLAEQALTDRNLLDSPPTSRRRDSCRDGQPSEKKRARIYREKISCSEAYAVHQRYSEPKTKKSSSVSAEEVLSTVKEHPREFSAFEVDIGTVLSNLKHAGK